MRKAARLSSDVWYLTKPYFLSEERGFAWGMLALLILLNLALVGLGLEASYARNVFYAALQAKNAAAFFTGMFWFTPQRAGLPIPGFVLIGLTIAVTASLTSYSQQWLQIRWRRWLSARFIDDWLGGHAHYRLQLATGGATPGSENPEQRIEDDINLVTDNTLTLTTSLISNVVTLVTYGGVLWSLSGVIVIAGYHVRGSLLIASVLIALVSTLITHLTGRKLARLDFAQQRFSAEFRFGLMRIRENSEAVALLDGEAEESRGARRRFADVYDNFRSIMHRTALVNVVTGGLQSTADYAALVLSAPRLFAGRITLGTVMQSAQIFGDVSNSILWFVSNYAALASYVAQVERLATFRRAIDQARATPDGVETGDGPALAASDIALRLPDGRALLPPLTFTLAPGMSTAIVAPSGTGKSTLFRTMAGIWPYAAGELTLPAGTRMFLPQRPYMPEGTLRRALAYPRDGARYGAAETSAALRAVGLAALEGQLDDERPWAQILSPGEQQRLAVARALLARPDWLFLDEASSALDEDAEAALYASLRAVLPQTTLVSITHREEVASRHEQVLRLAGASGLAAA